ncbi:hypothetical protein [Salinispira pacifica]|uniref:hypothetical protein n=1 Tax=Salinispira pacifica TaxID=1307761 RepID=UPI0004047666|nr:hypothetical protein [Salinispira pacifica]
MTSSDTGHSSRQILEKYYGNDLHIIGSAELAVVKNGRPAQTRWGVCFISGSPDSPVLVHFAFDKQDWVESLTGNRREPVDTSLEIPLSSARLLYAEKPGFLKRLLGSDVGMVELASDQAKTVRFRSGKGETLMVEAERFGFNVESVKAFTRHLLEYLPSGNSPLHMPKE